VPVRFRLVPAARLELARLAAADFESATSTDFVTRAGGLIGRAEAKNHYHTQLRQHSARAATIEGQKGA
jgi:hypothetical protein